MVEINSLSNSGQGTPSFIAHKIEMSFIVSELSTQLPWRRGRIDLAKMILDIAAAQYAPPDAPQAHRYHVAADSDDEEDACNSDCASDEGESLIHSSN